MSIRNPLFAFGTRQNRIFTGDFHMPAKKAHFSGLFYSFSLAFPSFLGYSPSGPSFSRKKRGVANSEPASIASGPAPIKPGWKVKSGG
jgi:hypothetical protein